MHVLIRSIFIHLLFSFYIIVDTHQNAKAGYLAIYGETKIVSCVFNISLVAVEIEFILIW